MNIRLIFKNRTSRATFQEKTKSLARNIYSAISNDFFPKNHPPSRLCRDSDRTLYFMRIPATHLSDFGHASHTFFRSLPSFPLSLILFFSYALIRAPPRQVRFPFKFISSFTIPSLFLFSPLLGPCHLLDAAACVPPFSRVVFEPFINGRHFSRYLKICNDRD